MRSLVWSALVLVIGIISVLLIKASIFPLSIGAAPSTDLILDRIPTFGSYGIAVYGPVVVLSILVVHLFLLPWYAPVAWKTIGFVYLLRACFIILTPLGMPDEQHQKIATSMLQSITYGGNDFFFSGHVAFPFLLALIFWKNRFMRIIYLLLAALLGAAVLAEHVHYSIDVFGAPFVVYCIWAAYNKYFRSDLNFVEAAEARFSS